MPVISTIGIADTLMIKKVIDAAREGGCKEQPILHCVSGYSAPAEDYNLRTLPDLIQRFGLVTGLSDHTLDNTTAITSEAMGACIIEKHFTLNRSRTRRQLFAGTYGTGGTVQRQQHGVGGIG
jgi:sialic acid synthase SpsE